MTLIPSNINFISSKGKLQWNKIKEIRILWQGYRFLAENITDWFSWQIPMMALKIIKFMQTMVRLKGYFTRKRVVFVFWFPPVCWSIAWWVNMLRDLHLDLWVLKLRICRTKACGLVLIRFTCDSQRSRTLMTV